MIRAIIGGAVAAALLWGPAQAAARKPTLSWVVMPTDSGCRVDLELSGRSGGVTPVTLESDGQLVSLKFFKDELPARAFLPIRVDRARYSNLMLRGPDGSGELVLSEETEAAMRRGTSLDIAWLAEEPLSASLAGSEQGLSDLRVCGAQAANRRRDRQATELAARERADADARARALNDAQIAAVQAQRAAADAQRRQVEETAARQRRVEAAEQERVYMEARQRAYDDAVRRRAYDQTYYDDEERWAPPPRPLYLQPRWGYYYRN